MKYFVRVSCRRHHQPTRMVTHHVMQALAGAPWAGNVRELQHYIERAVVTTKGPELDCRDLIEMATDPPMSNLRTAVRGVAQQVNGPG